MLICDTSGLLARYDPDDRQHAAATRVLDRADLPYVVSPLVLAELEYLLRSRHGAQPARTVLADVLGGGFEVPTLDRTAMRECLAVDRQYADVGLGLVDASLVVLAERYGTLDLLTLDLRHFRAISPLQGGAFRLLPADDGDSA